MKNHVISVSIPFPAWQTVIFSEFWLIAAFLANSQSNLSIYHLTLSPTISIWDFALLWERIQCDTLKWTRNFAMNKKSLHMTTVANEISLQIQKNIPVDRKLIQLTYMEPILCVLNRNFFRWNFFKCSSQRYYSSCNAILILRTKKVCYVLVSLNGKRIP